MKKRSDPLDEEVLWKTEMSDKAVCQPLFKSFFLFGYEDLLGHVLALEERSFPHWRSITVTAAVVHLLNLKHHHRDANISSPRLPDPPNRLAVKIEALHQTEAACTPPPCVVTRKVVLVAARNAATCLPRKITSLKSPLPLVAWCSEKTPPHKHTQMVFHFWSESSINKSTQKQRASLRIDPQVQFHSPVKGSKGSRCVTVGSHTVFTSSPKTGKESSSVVI